MLTVRRPLVSLDGGGVVADEVVVWSEDTVHDDRPVRLRVHLTDYPGGDVTVYVEGGVLHVVGHYGTVHAERIAPNIVGLNVVQPGRRPR